jgi:hypothetical protein
MGIFLDVEVRKRNEKPLSHFHIDENLEIRTGGASCGLKFGQGRLCCVEVRKRNKKPLPHFHIEENLNNRTRGVSCGRKFGHGHFSRRGSEKEE